jgi:nitroimidazol reductase NimA-like FMN-containing flavoprotein (pyridoxamine 5'-phosphate oxidase superfamily)
MSEAPQVRRADKLMSNECVGELLARGFYGRLATVGADGWPYVVPLLYLWMNDEIWVHNSGGQGHLRTNVEHAAKVCFESRTSLIRCRRVVLLRGPGRSSTRHREHRLAWELAQRVH